MKSASLISVFQKPANWNYRLFIIIFLSTDILFLTSLMCELVPYIYIYVMKLKMSILELFFNI